ncbi:MAG: TOBE domain-containing protein, partial [Brachymonas sp.]
PTMNMIPAEKSPLARPTGAAQLGLRPEHITLQPDSDWRGMVTLVEPTGADTFVDVDAAGTHLTVRVSPEVSIAAGQQIGLSANTQALHWFDAQGVRLA